MRNLRGQSRFPISRKHDIPDHRIQFISCALPDVSSCTALAILLSNAITGQVPVCERGLIKLELEYLNNEIE